MITMDSCSMKMIGPGQYKSMGTGGLKPEEVQLAALSFTLCDFRIRHGIHHRFAR
jgi:hypothetical protein